VGSINDEFNGFYDILIKSHTPCDILDEESLRREDISRYSVLILPNAACTGKAADDKLRDYVRGGGNIIASFETSLCDETGRRRTTSVWPTSSASGFSGRRSGPIRIFIFTGTTTGRCLFRRPGRAFSRRRRFPARSRRTGPRRSARSRSSSRVGTQRDPAVEFPAITVNRFGKGRAIYLAGPFGEHYWKFKQPDIRFVLGNLIRWLSPRS